MRWTSRPSVEVDEDDEQIVGRVDGEDVGPADRTPRPDDRRGAAALLPGRVPRASRSESGWSWTPPATGSAASEAIERQADRAADRALKTGKEIELEPMTPERAPRRPPAPQGSRRGRDVQRGRGARALRDRRPAAQRLSAGPSAAARAADQARAALATVLELLASDPHAAERGARPGAGLAGPRRRLADRPRGRGAAQRAADRRRRGRRRLPRPARSRPRCPRPGRPDRVDRRASASSSARRSSERGSPMPRSSASAPRAGRPAPPRVAARLTTRSPPGPSAASRLWPSWRRRCWREGGALVAWKGRRDPDEEAELDAPRTAWRWSRARSLAWARTRAPAPPPVRASKARPDPRRLPRRAGTGEEAPLRWPAEVRPSATR